MYTAAAIKFLTKVPKTYTEEKTASLRNDPGKA
jgi:hypothetical protein